MIFTAAIFLALMAQDPTQGKTLVWSDDFSGKGLPDNKKWLYENGKVRNNEDQFYTTDRLENARVRNGQLTIEARQESWQGSNVTSAALESRQSWKYGYFEVKAKIPTGRGTWPAIWFLGQSIREKGDQYIGWPACGEIDLMENVGFDPSLIHFNIHTVKNYGGSGSVFSHHIDVPDAYTAFHTYGLDWYPDRLDFYFDGAKVMTYLNGHEGKDSWPFDAPEFIVLNLAIGGGWGGQKGVDSGIFPSKFEVKYVKVYQ